MEVLGEMEAMGHERVLFARDAAAGYRAVIAIHDTTLGRAVGGTRIWGYADERAALTDALRLSRGMTYKNAAAGLPLGGGKSVILRPAGEFDRGALLRAHGRAVESLGGGYLTAEDVGTTPADMEIVREETRHVAGLASLSGDPSPWTARGVLRGMQAAAQERWGSEKLEGRTVAIQGCGNVGSHLAALLAELGARLVVADVDEARARRLGGELGAALLPPEEIHRVEADVFSPCALGGILNAASIPELRVEVVAGAANNQLAEEGDGEALAARGILYAPDYVVNAGGVINGCREIVGWEPERAREAIDAIFDRTLRILELAEAGGIPPHRAADRYAEERLRAARG